MFDKLAEAEANGWSLSVHDVSAEKDGHVFKGEPEDVLERIARFDEHGDFKRAAIETAERREQAQAIESLLMRAETARKECLRESAEHDRLWAEAEAVRAQPASTAHEIKRRSDETHRLSVLSRSPGNRANDALAVWVRALEELNTYPKEVLRAHGVQVLQEELA